MRTQIRIVGGQMRGRKLTCDVNPHLRPTPQRVREALFNILRNAVPDRPFIDVFAGTGVIGLEALSRGASSVEFIEQDGRQVQEIRRHIATFDVADSAVVVQSDAYRWARKWQPPLTPFPSPLGGEGEGGPVNIYISPPFPHLQRQTDDLLEMLATLQERTAPESIIILQSEFGSKLEGHEALATWEKRRYGRNELLIWQKLP